MISEKKIRTVKNEDRQFSVTAEYTDGELSSVVLSGKHGQFLLSPETFWAMTSLLAELGLTYPVEPR